jgi:hypothetical protein
MVQEISVGPADFARNRLECHGLRPLLDQQAPGRFQRGGTAFFGVQAFTGY